MTLGRRIGGAFRRTEVLQRVRAGALATWRRSALVASPYFDPRWYLANNEDVRVAGLDPFEHFLDYGERENRRPGPRFDPAEYVSRHPDADGAALTHFHLGLGRLKTSEALLRALTTGWFDEAWYRRTHTPDAGTQLAAEDPLEHNGRAGLDPSPFFDHADYREQLTAAGIDQDPVDHWIAEQSTRTTPSIRPRVVARTPTRPPGQPLVQHRVSARSELADTDVAVMIHAYYLDLLPELLARLSVLPTTPALLVSVTTTADAADAHRTIDTYMGTGQPRVVKVVPNRGRNFGPLLCAFADDIREHDLLLHLHTKKSLHTGEGLADWRTHLLDSLLPSAAGVDAILSLLRDDPSVGVVHAPTWEPLRHFSDYWFDNSTWGADLYERLGITDRSARGYVSYPVGGMFWMRVDALRPLLDLGLTVGDFEREHGQIDGALAHAIERTIPAAAAVAGFDTVQFDYVESQWRRNWSPRYHSEFGPDDVDELRRLLATADLVTVAFFGTLTHQPSLVAASDDPESQSDAAQTADDGQSSGVQSPLATATPRTWLIDALLHARAQPSQRDRRHQRFILMTDTDEPRSVVEDVLETIGAGPIFDALYISNECRARKDDGSMWELIRAAENPAPSKWLHIGHDDRSDVQMAISASVGPLHVPVRESEVSAALRPGDQPGDRDPTPAGGSGAH